MTHTIYVLQFRVCDGDTWDDMMFTENLYTAKQHKLNFQSAEKAMNYRIIFRTTTDKIIES